jgi:hypothetical protein
MDIDNHNISPAGIQVNTIVLTFTLVAGLVVFLRLFTRLVLRKTGGLEDACIVFAMVSEPILSFLSCCSDPFRDIVSRSYR